MKLNYKKICSGFILVAALSATGCKKYLDQQPITEVGPDMVFTDVSSTYQAIAGVYSRLTGDQGYGIRLSLYYPLDQDETQGPTGASDGDRRDIARYAVTPTNAQLERPFNQLFQGIDFANICIDQIPKSPAFTGGSDKEKGQMRRMLGEALTLRAQFYFEAIRNWGDLPSHFEPAYVQATKVQFPSRENRDVLYDQILNDLKTASDLVPWRNQLSTIGDPMDERITKGTVKALRARIALFRGGYALRVPANGGATGTMERTADYQKYYQIAKEECESIMNSGQHSLNPSFKDLWKNQVGGRVIADPHGELLFQVSGIGNGAVADTKLGYYNGPAVGSFGNRAINTLPTFFYLYDSTDLRRDVTIAPYNINADGASKVGTAITAMNEGKYRRDWINNPAIAPTNAIQYFNLKWQVIRYADVLLMYAEAENELNGPTTSAYNAINMVRRRGYGKPLNTADATVDIPAGLSKTDFFKAIVRERSLELSGEGIRKYDLIRWNLLGAAIADVKANLQRMSTNTSLVNPTYMLGYPSYSLGTLPMYMYYNTGTTADDATIWRNSFYTAGPSSTPSGTTRVNWLTAAVSTTALARYATNFQSGKSELLPIPQAAITANPNLKQNPGYQ